LAVYREEVVVSTTERFELVDVTGVVEGVVSRSGIREGIVHVFVPHATAGVALIETGAGSEDDLLSAIDELLPANQGRWRHSHGSPGHGRDHILPAFISPSLTIPVVAGRMTLGTWQSLVLVDTNVDNPTRRVRFSFIPG